VLKARAFLLATLLVASCSGNDDGDKPGAVSQAASPTVTATSVREVRTETALPATTEPEATAPPDLNPNAITGTFLEPRPTMAVWTVALGEPEVPAMEPWDRQSVVLYDLEAATSTNFGPGYFAGFSGDGTRFAYNHEGKLWVVDIASGGQTSYDVSGGLASLIGDHYAIAPAAEGSLVDLNTGGRSSVEAIVDPDLRYVVEQRLRPAGGALLGGGLVLRQADWNNPPCASVTEEGHQRCRAEAFEQWWVEELATARRVLEFRAIAASPAGPGELIIATSPLCAKPDGTTAWCEDALAAWRPSLDRSSKDPQYAEGTTNIFLVNVSTGDAQFVATAAYRPHAFISPANWPLIANEDFVVWTESYCGLPQGKTRIYDRATGEITELDSGAWVRWHGDLIGIGDFSSRAILDPVTLEYVAAVAPELSGVGWSPDLRFAVVGAVLGHGGLCG
jgi:hypothetical protein